MAAIALLARAAILRAASYARSSDRRATTATVAAAVGRGSRRGAGARRPPATLKNYVAYHSGRGHGPVRNWR